jgi:uncharacterized membrane protein
MVDAAFNMIRQNAQAIPAVSIHLLETLATIGAQTHRETDRRALLRQARLVSSGCKEQLSAEDDRKDIDERQVWVLEALDMEKE